MAVDQKDMLIAIMRDALLAVSDVSEHGARHCWCGPYACEDERHTDVCKQARVAIGECDKWKLETPTLLELGAVVWMLVEAKHVAEQTRDAAQSRASEQALELQKYRENCVCGAAD